MCKLPPSTTYRNNYQIHLLVKCIFNWKMFVAPNRKWELPLGFIVEGNQTVPFSVEYRGGISLFQGKVVLSSLNNLYEMLWQFEECFSKWFVVFTYKCYFFCLYWLWTNVGSSVAGAFCLKAPQGKFTVGGEDESVQVQTCWRLAASCQLPLATGLV